MKLAARDKFQYFVNAPVGLLVARLDRNNNSVTIDLANDAFCRLMGYATNELDGSPFEKIAPSAQALQLAIALKSLEEGSTSSVDVELSKKDSSIFECRLALTTVKDDTDKFILSAEDLSAIRAAEAQLLERAGTEQREDFIATLTHDLKTPIVGANMVLTALLDGSLGQLVNEQRDIISKLKLSNQALLKMIQNLLEIYKYESGSESFIFGVMDLLQIARFCSEEISPLIQSKKLTFKLEVPEKPLLAYCDEYAIRRVILNLLSNAVKFTPETGQIVLSLQRQSDNALLQVRDTGRGVDPSDLGRLFQRFYQGEPGKRYAVGTGLGLYFCHSVVKAHGGSITCDSKLGLGTTFSIVLPLTTDKQ